LRPPSSVPSTLVPRGTSPAYAQAPAPATAARTPPLTLAASSIRTRRGRLGPPSGSPGADTVAGPSSGQVTAVTCTVGRSSAGGFFSPYSVTATSIARVRGRYALPEAPTVTNARRSVGCAGQAPL